MRSGSRKPAKLDKEETPMRKPALVLVTAAALAMVAVASPSPAHARYYGYGPGIVGGLVAGALIAGIASSAYGYGPGYGYYGGYYPGYYGGYYPAYYGGYYPEYYGGYVYRRLLRLQPFTRPDTSTTAVLIITAAGIAVGVAGNVVFWQPADAGKRQSVAGIAARWFGFKPPRPNQSDNRNGCSRANPGASRGQGG